ncbi:MAG: hypothetical protein HGA75_09935 [Thiobacillus sp.]|nr:hypothetical protein [Thiobacillus sp.]
MRKLELDFLQVRPPTPVLSWLLLAVGVLLSAMTFSRYLDVADELTEQQAQAAKLTKSAPGRARTGQPVVAAAAPDNVLLGVPWGELFARLEETRPAKIAFLSVQADGRKRSLSLTAEAASAADMIDYLETLRRKGGFQAVTLSGHTVMVADDGSESLQFTTRMNWGP